MKPTISIHGVAKLNLGGIDHYPARETAPEFWSRTLHLKDDKGEGYALSLFSHTADGLLTVEERREAAKKDDGQRPPVRQASLSDPSDALTVDMPAGARIAT